MFTKETYQLRRRELAESLSSGIILLLGNEESSINFKDNIYPFRQDSSFLYFFGIDRPDLTAIIDIDEQKTTLFGDDLSVEHIIWMGAQPLLADQAERVGVTNTAKGNDVQEYLTTAAKKKRKVHYLPPYRPENSIKLHQLLGIPLSPLLMVLQAI